MDGKERTYHAIKQIQNRRIERTGRIIAFVENCSIAHDDCRYAILSRDTSSIANSGDRK